MKNLLFLSLLILCVPVSINAQYRITGTVTDFDTKEPIQCATISLWADDVDIETRTDADGKFIIELDHNDEYEMYITADYYRSEEALVVFDNDFVVFDFELYSYESENYRIDDVASFDVFSTGAGISFFSPTLVDSDKDFSSNITMETFYYDFRARMADRIQLGFKYSPLKLQWSRFAEPDSIYSKERYFSVSAALSMYVRFIATTKKSTGGTGMFIDLGATYSIPYYYAHVGISADNKYQKTSIRHIHKLNDFEAMVRLGYSWGAIKATYRFTDILKNNYVQPPRLQIGIDLFIPAE